MGITVALLVASQAHLHAPFLGLAWLVDRYNVKVFRLVSVDARNGADHYCGCGTRAVAEGFLTFHRRHTALPRTDERILLAARRQLPLC